MEIGPIRNQNLILQLQLQLQFVVPQFSRVVPEKTTARVVPAGDNSKNSVKSINSLAHAELQSSKCSMIHANMLFEVKHFSKIHLDVDKLRALIY